MSKYNLIGVGSNAKTIKGDGSEYITGILYMTPWKVSVNGKLFNSCAMAEQASCIDGCLHTSGRAGIIKTGETTNTILAARERKAQLFYTDRDAFMALLFKDVAKLIAECAKTGAQPCIRLNGTTDIRWELILVDGKNIFEHFPQVQWYDYTKIANRKVSHIKNYHLTWSYSKANAAYAKMFDIAIEQGMNVAVVFRNKVKPAAFNGLPVIDGDKDDLRFLDPQGVIVGLYAKGKAKKDTSGFVVDA